MMNIQLITITVYFVTMQFGYIDGKLEDIDFTLPADPAFTTETLNTAKRGDSLQVYVGASKWAQRQWLGIIYPFKTPDNEFLTLYARNFNTIEFGATFYNIYKPEELLKPTEMVKGSPEFRFLPKFPQMITHLRRLVNAEKNTKDFYESLVAFGDQLGPLLLQLGDNYSPKLFPQLKKYLEGLPLNRAVTLEVRHKDWFAVAAHRDELANLLRRLNINWAMSDVKGRRDCVHMHLTTADVVIRFVGNNLHESDYTRIDAWVDRFKVWQEQGLQSIWFFVHQFDERTVPPLCDYLIKQINSKLNLQVKGPSLISRDRNV